MSKVNRTTQQDRNRKAIAAIQKYLGGVTTMLIAGVNYKTPDFVALLQKDSAIADAATSARQALRVAAQAARDQHTTMTPVRAGFRAYLANMFTDPSIIAEFGFAPHTRQVPTAETKAAAVEKRKATRAARHTLGSRQKAGIKGTAAPSPVAGAPPSPSVPMPTSSSVPVATPSPVVVTAPSSGAPSGGSAGAPPRGAPATGANGSTLAAPASGGS